MLPGIRKHNGMKGRYCAVKKRMVILAAALAVCMSASVFASAEEAPKKSPGDAIGTLIGSLLEDKDISEGIFGEDGLLNEVLPEGIDLDEIAGSLEEKAGVIKAEGQQVIDDIIEKVQNEDGSFDLEGIDLDGLKNLAGGLLGSLVGDSDLEGFDMGEYLARFDSVKDAMKEYYLAKNSEIMEDGDVQILSTTLIYVDEDLVDEVTAFAQIIQENYTEDEKILRSLCSSSVPVLFKFSWDEENSRYVVADAREAADGEEYTASLEEMCSEVGITLEECLEDIDFSDYIHTEELVNYMKEHPELEGIEFEGEVLNAEELDAFSSELLMEYFDEYDMSADSTEAVVVESVESAA